MNEQNRKIVEELPVSLTYEISKPSANQELKQKVLNGEIKSLKEYKELENKLRQTEEEKKKLEQELKEERNKPPKIETKIIEKEVDYTDYKTIQKLNNQINIMQKKMESLERQRDLLETRLKQEEKEVEEYRKLKEEMNYLHSKKDDLHREIESATELSGLVVEIEHLLKTKLAPVKYSRALSEQRHNEIVIDNLNEIIDRVITWCKEMKSLIPKKQTDTIDVEVIDYE